MSNPVVNIYGSSFIYYTCDRDPTINEPLVYNNYSNLLLFWWNTTSNDLFWCVDTTANAMIWIKEINDNNLLSELSSVGIGPSFTPIGTSNQIIVTPTGSDYTFSTPQDIDSASTPTFSGINLSGLNPSNFVLTDSSKNLSTQDSSSVKSLLGLNINTSRSYSLRSSPTFSTSYTPSATNDTLVIAVVNCVGTLINPGTVLFQVDTGSGFVTVGEGSVSGVVASVFSTITCLVPANAQYKLVNSSGTATIVSINEINL